MRSPSTSRIEDPLAAVAAIVQANTGLDLSIYRPSMVRRRVAARMDRLGIRTFETYLERLAGDAAESDRLVADVHVGVSAFFRDPEAFQNLEAIVDSYLERRADPHAELRVWVAGCARGQEAYSIALLLTECLARAMVRPKLRVFATDADGAAIDFARRGSYSRADVNEIAPDVRARLFVEQGDRFVVERSIRDSVIFSRHDLTRDPPFRSIDLVVCRNVLIYFEPAVQAQLLEQLAYASKRGGLLFLGPCERASEAFTAVDAKWRIYRRRTEYEVSALEVVRRRRRSHLGSSATPKLEEVVLDAVCPAAVVVGPDGAILFAHGDTSAYLRDDDANVIRASRGGLGARLGAALLRARAGECAIEIDDVAFRSDGAARHVDLRVSPVSRASALRGCMVISFERPRPRRGVHGDESSPALNELVELNENLEATNEELRTATEQLHALDQELRCVNEQLERKMAEVARANDELENVLESARVACIILDPKLRIVRFTEPVRKILPVVPSDLGRPFADVAAFACGADEVERVARSLVTEEAELTTPDGSSWIRRIAPYRTVENCVEGVVVTFVQSQSKSVARLDRRHPLATAATTWGMR